MSENETLSTEQFAEAGASTSAEAAEASDTRSTTESTTDADVQLLDPAERDTMTNQWRDIQADFVDHPRQAMADADKLVAGLMQQLARTFADERAQLEGQWSRGDDVSTEDLRLSLQRYRAFFERLLAV